MFAASTILYKMIVCLSESRGGLHLGNLFLATVDSAIKVLLPNTYTLNSERTRDDWLLLI